jgi:hypothetical protein
MPWLAERTRPVAATGWRGGGPGRRRVARRSWTGPGRVGGRAGRRLTGVLADSDSHVRLPGPACLPAHRPGPAAAGGRVERHRAVQAGGHAPAGGGWAGGKARASGWPRWAGEQARPGGGCERTGPGLQRAAGCRAGFKSLHTQRELCSFLVP